MFDKEALEERVQKFRGLELPGQPQSMHVGTMMLVDDLWKEVQRLRQEFGKIESPGE